MTNFSCLCKIDKPHRGLVDLPLGNLGNAKQVRTVRNIGKNTFFGGSGSLMAGSSVTDKKRNLRKITINAICISKKGLLYVCVYCYTTCEQ